MLFREIRDPGYDGGETRLKQFVRGLSPAAAAEPIVRFETEPGHQMQADWAGLKRRRPISKEPGVQVAGRFQPGRGV